MFDTASATFAMASPVFALLFSVAALAHMGWVYYGGFTCGAFECCSSTECKEMSSVSGGWSAVSSRANGAGAFLLISIFILIVAVVFVALALNKKWQGFFGVIGIITLLASAITLWLSVFIAVGTPQGFSSDPLWLMVYAGTIALGGLFFALHARAHATSVASDASKDTVVENSPALMGAGGGYQNGAPGAAYHSGPTAYPQPGGYNAGAPAPYAPK